MAKYLDATGLTHLIQKLKTIFAQKATTLSGYGITDGINTVTHSGQGTVVTAASISGHRLTLTRGQYAPVIREEKASLSSSPSNFASHELLVFDASALSYSAGKEFWVNIIQLERNLGRGHYTGYVITGANTCYLKFGGVQTYVIGGTTQLAASSVYRFELFAYGNTRGNFTRGYVTWQRLGAK